jgi:hypothetical protein
VIILIRRLVSHQVAHVEEVFPEGLLFAHGDAFPFADEALWCERHVDNPFIGFYRKTISLWVTIPLSIATIFLLYLRKDNPPYNGLPLTKQYLQTIQALSRFFECLTVIRRVSLFIRDLQPNDPEDCAVQPKIHLLSPR